MLLQLRVILDLLDFDVLEGDIRVEVVRDVDLE